MVLEKSFNNLEKNIFNKNKLMQSRFFCYNFFFFHILFTFNHFYALVWYCWFFQWNLILSNIRHCSRSSGDVQIWKLFSVFFFLVKLSSFKNCYNKTVFVDDSFFVGDDGDTLEIFRSTRGEAHAVWNQEIFFTKWAYR